ncbi:hypothetical protein [Anabaena lutea]|uniref:Uncharacterized protein n=1 Tax=Anabaena lutea FACHB-196 TaxID=2692881 RepID=A0ABR8FDJ9_9NOST|nr:hypothetical protein [Anabaena lutea]MBD2568216.1 hypothetical protein [Anabaena lutea FACHB-196]
MNEPQRRIDTRRVASQRVGREGKKKEESSQILILHFYKIGMLPSAVNSPQNIG